MRSFIRALACVAALTAPLCAIAQAPESFAIDPQRGIDERVYLDIDGVAEHVLIRGEDRDNPVLLFLHGGPGAAASLYAWKYFARGGWEKHFTVVHWDQPGAGKTFERAGSKLDPNLTVDRIVDDGIAVSTAIARKLGKHKIVLVGHVGRREDGEKASRSVCSLRRRGPDREQAAGRSGRLPPSARQSAGSEQCDGHRGARKIRAAAVRLHCRVPRAAQVGRGV
jgi:hypothetical protein